MTSGTISKVQSPPGQERHPQYPFASGISDIQRHGNDQDSVLAWIREWQEKGEESPVLYCKLQGEEAKDEYPLLKEDFIIVIPFQRMMLAKFGKNGVYIDWTRGTKACDFTLNTIMVADEFGSGFPVIFAHEIVAYIKDLCSLCSVWRGNHTS